MTSQVIMDDGNESTISDHIRDDHRKGTRGMSDEYLSNTHSTPHQRKQAPEHGQPGKDRDKDAPGDDREPARPAKQGNDNKKDKRK